jgi:hypothetical protein
MTLRIVRIDNRRVQYRVPIRIDARGWMVAYTSRLSVNDHL